MCVCIYTLQEYEDKVSRLQAEYSAEQESKAKLQEDITALRCSYETKLAHLEASRATRGRSSSTTGAVTPAIRENTVCRYTYACIQVYIRVYTYSILHVLIRTTVFNNNVCT